MINQETKITMGRRRFTKGAMAAGVAAAFPAIVPSTVLGANAPSNRFATGIIGAGRMGRGDLTDAMGHAEIQMIAACDVDSNRVQDAKVMIDSKYAEPRRSGSYKGCDVHGDFRELLARDDIDAVLICTPDHWHAIPAVAAAQAGKDIFVQKPLSLTIAGGRALSDAVRRYRTVYLTGSQQRSDARFRQGCELVRNGRIGKLLSVKVGCGVDPGCGIEEPMPVPKSLNYDMWLGQAPWKPYTEKRVHPPKGYGRPGWLRISDYGAGMLTGWGSHHMDIAHWGMGMEYGGPLTVQAKGEFPEEGLWDVHGAFQVDYEYPNDVKLMFADNKKTPQGVRFEGTEGWVYVRRGHISAEPASLLKSVIGPDELHLYKSNDHKGNWVECMKTRAETVAPAEIGHRSCSACLLGDIAMRLERKLQWDAEKERFVNDPEADRMLSRPMRSPWHL